MTISLPLDRMTTVEKLQTIGSAMGRFEQKKRMNLFHRPGTRKFYSKRDKKIYLKARI